MPWPSGAVVEPTVGELTFMGTATVLLRCGMSILTDHNFLHAGDHA